MDKIEWQMTPREAEAKIAEMQRDIEQHQKDFKEQTRIDSVDVIIRRKDKNLEPIQPPKLNMAQMRINKLKNTPAELR